MFYKYRGLSNLKYALDILVNSRMFAAQFQELNDPMEGVYTYALGTLQPRDIDAISGDKNDYRLLSLSKTSNNMLMWAHYAEGHRGMVIGVDVEEKHVERENVSYVSDLALELTGNGEWGHRDTAIRILSKKYDVWAYEQEHRVFVRAQSYVKVKIRDLIFGIGTDADTKGLVTKIAQKFCSKARVRTITREELSTCMAGIHTENEPGVNVPRDRRQ